MVFYISGHGLHDGYLNQFFFCPIEFDPMIPEELGISFEDLENLLGNTECRQKLLLLNTCMAGQPDPDRNSVKNERSFDLMKEYYWDLSVNSGASVFSASNSFGYTKESKNSSGISPLANAFLNSISKKKENLSVGQIFSNMEQMLNSVNTEISSQTEVRQLNTSGNFSIF